MTTLQIVGGVMLLAVIITLLATVGLNPAVIVALGVAVVLYYTSLAKART